jgi:hypothetical protein
MRVHAALGVLAATLVITPSPTQAQYHAWCARYDPSTWNCGFSTLAQCLATISGVGGRCVPNPHYQPRRQEEPRRVPRPRSD